MKRNINILGSIVLVLVTVTGFYFSNFSGIMLLLGGEIIILWCMIEYLLKSNSELEEDNNEQNKEIKILKENINTLNNKISMIAMSANEKSPYKIQFLCEPDINKGIKINQYYIMEIIVSTIDSKYNIKYLNISFNNRVVIEQDKILTHKSMYKATSNMLKQRRGRYEYNFEITDKYVDRTCAKCLFKLKYSERTALDMNIEIDSGIGINKIEIINYTLI